MMDVSANQFLRMMEDLRVDPELGEQDQTKSEIGLHLHVSKDTVYRQSTALPSKINDSRSESEKSEQSAEERLRKAEIQLKANRIKGKRMKEKFDIEKSEMHYENEKLAAEIQDLFEELRESENRLAQALAENAYLKSQNKRLEEERDAIAEQFHDYRQQKISLEPETVEHRIAAARAEERNKAAAILTEQKQAAEALAVAQARADILEFEIKCMKEELDDSQTAGRASEPHLSFSNHFECSADVSQRSESIADKEYAKKTKNSLANEEKIESSQLVPATKWMKNTVLDLFSRQAVSADDHGHERRISKTERRRLTKTFSDPRLDKSMQDIVFDDEPSFYTGEGMHLFLSDSCWDKALK